MDFDVDALTAYLEEKVQAISEAEPAVLAEYIVALLRHKKPVPVLKEDCMTELTDFLGDDTATFVNQLFEGLLSGRFAASQPAPAAAGSANPDSNTQGKRQREASIDISRRSRSPDGRHAPSTHPAHPSTSDHAAHSSASGGQQRQHPYRVVEDNYRPEKRRDFGDRSEGNGYGDDRRQYRSGAGNDRFGQGDRRRGRCYNYDEKGYCLRGQDCPYEHGPEALLIENLTPGASASRTGSDRFGQNADNFAVGSVPPGDGRGRSFPRREGANPRAYPYPPGPHGGPRTGSVRGRYRTLAVENIPQEFCSMDKVNEFFKPFGTLTNIQVDPIARRATIQYSHPNEASAANSSPEPFFGNRFVKVFFKRDETEVQGMPSGHVAAQAPPEPLDPAEQAAKAALEEQAKLAAKAAFEEKQAARLEQDRIRQEFEQTKTQQAVLAKKIEEQKQIMHRLITDKTLTAKDKADLKATLKALTEQTQAMVASTASQTQLAKERTAAVAAPLGASVAAAAAGGGATPAAPAEGGEAAMLKEKLAALQAEAKQLGIPDASADGSADAAAAAVTHPYGAGGWTRGRGGAAWNRGRGGFVGRGGGQMGGRMTLDNRPTRILVSNLSAAIEAAAKTHYEGLPGHVGTEKVDDASMIVQYQQRWQAEQAWNNRPKGEEYQGIQLSWHTAPATPAAPAVAAPQNAESQ
ncbi:hypothetical protein BC831DRAFT_470273 [Entophlyctis helioformis]|nr:hypothetical protein BC831DRAFT_470273 [Entophlyctis helioformis]